MSEPWKKYRVRRFGNGEDWKEVSGAEGPEVAAIESARDFGFAGECVGPQGQTSAFCDVEVDLEGIYRVTQEIGYGLMRLD